MKRRSERTPTPPALATALMCALIVVAHTGVQAAHAPSASQKVAVGSENERGRLLAAAVAATCDLFGLDRAAVTNDVLVPCIAAPAPDNGRWITAASVPACTVRRPAARLMNIPPPVC